jgi:hypothetical protein
MLTISNISLPVRKPPMLLPGLAIQGQRDYQLDIAKVIPVGVYAKALTGKRKW